MSAPTITQAPQIGCGAPAYPPPLGRDTRSVLADVLGCSAEEITSLVADQVVFERPINAQSMEEKT